jgi:hypothetical protein
MPTPITAEPTTGPDTFILRTTKRDGNTVHTSVLRRQAEGWGAPIPGSVQLALTWEELTMASDGHEVTIELIAVPPVNPDPELNIADVKRRMGLWNDTKAKWTSIGGRGLAIGLITRELPMLIKIAEAAAAPRTPKTEA